MPRTVCDTKETYRELSKAVRSPFNLILEGESEVGKEYFARLIHRERNWGGGFVVYDCEQTGQGQSEIVGGLTSETFLERLRQPHKKDTFFVRRLDLLKGILHAQLSDFFEQLAESGQFSRKELLSLGIIGSVQPDGSRFSPENGRLNRLLDILFCLRIRILPLRERRAEIPRLVERFVHLFNCEHKKEVEGVSAEALDILIRHDWPNNVCQLRTEIERAITLTQDHHTITPDALSDDLVGSASRTRSLD
jgi:transcriptional regulator of acetoin/glycerol metabolism